MQVGLKEQILKKINESFSLWPEIERVYLYGSRAKGDFRPGSDIDLAVVAPGLSLPGLLRIENQLDDLLLPWNIDIVLFHQISNPELINHIRRVGIIVYKKGD